MAGSIPASATSRSRVARLPSPLEVRARDRRIWRSMSGTLGFGITGALLAVALLAGRIAPGDPFASVGPPLRPPSAAYPMGTDDLGRDLFTGVVHGTRTSLLVALAVTLVASCIGMALGTVSGWRGGVLDDALMR